MTGNTAKLSLYRLIGEITTLNNNWNSMIETRNAMIVFFFLSRVRQIFGPNASRAVLKTKNRKNASHLTGLQRSTFKIWLHFYLSLSLYILYMGRELSITLTLLCELNGSIRLISRTARLKLICMDDTVQEIKSKYWTSDTFRTLHVTEWEDYILWFIGKGSQQSPADQFNTFPIRVQC